jgi:hypothetical protein
MRASSLLVIGCMVVVVSCGTPPGSRPYAGTLPEDTQVDMAGAFTLSPGGELRLALARPCVVEVDSRKGSALVEVDCNRSHLDRIQVVARTPWNQEIRGTWGDAKHITFRADWKTTGIDPLAEDASAIVARPWVISGTQWIPSSAEAATILRLIGDATDTQTELVEDGPAPNLEVTTFAIEGDALRAGDPGTLLVGIANRGSGAAYRVVATTRSIIEGLHGQRLSFGSIKPGAEKVRRLQLTVPASEAARDTMLVLALSEGNGRVPANISRRIPIAPSSAAPVLAVQCTVGGRKVARPDLDAGQRLTLRCTVDNTGNAEARQVELEVSVSGGAPARSAPQAIAVSGHLAFNVPIIVPRTLPIDAPVEIAITARDRQSSRTARTTIVGVVRKPKLCVPGELTRAQYQAKVADLRAALADKVLTQAEFDRYDAELVACLK